MIKIIPIIIGVLWIFTTASTPAFAAKQIELTGEVPFNLKETEYFDIEVKIVELTAEEAGAVKDTLLNRIEVFVTDADSNNQIARVRNSEDRTKNIRYYWESLDSTIETGTDTDNFSYLKYRIRIANNQIEKDEDKLSTLLASKGAIKVKVKYGLRDEEGAYEGTVIEKEESFAQIFGAAKVSPENIIILGANERASVSWDYVESVAFSDGVTRTSPDVVVIAIENDGTDFPLDQVATILPKSKDDTDLPDSKCTFSPGTNGASCISCSDATYGKRTYIDVSKIKTLDSPRISAISTKANQAQLSVNNLENEKEYAIFVQYRNGVTRSSCYYVTPHANYSLNEITGGDNAENTDVRCFIATAAFGTPLDKNVIVLRWFRDKFLLTNSWGKKFVDFYYEKSPKYAKIISENQQLKYIVQGSLYPVVWSVEALQNMYNFPILTLVFLMMIFTLVYNQKKIFATVFTSKK